MQVEGGHSIIHHDQPSQRHAVGGGNEVPAPLGPLLSQILDELKQLRDRLEGVRKLWYTVDEIAQATGRTPYTIRRWVKEGRINAIRVSGTGPRGRLLIAHEEVSRLIGLGMGSEIPATMAE